MIGLSLISLVIIWIPCGFYTSAVAYEKGHSGKMWFWGGLFFGPIALISAAGLPDNKLRKALTEKQND
tara:strand:+ start:379 stop:582 length:204 start_codon:yes stop_codon:yes gene_type:complete